MGSETPLHLVGKSFSVDTDTLQISDAVQNFLLVQPNGLLHVRTGTGGMRGPDNEVRAKVRDLLEGIPHVASGGLIGPNSRREFFLSFASETMEGVGYERLLSLINDMNQYFSKQSFDDFKRLFTEEDWRDHLGACLQALNFERTRITTHHREFSYEDQRKRVGGQCAEFALMVALRALIGRFDASGKTRIHSRDDGDVELSDTYSLHFGPNRYSCRLLMRQRGRLENLGEQDLVIKTPEGFVLLDVTLSRDHLREKLMRPDTENVEAIRGQLREGGSPVDLRLLYVYCNDHPHPELPPGVACFPGRPLAHRILEATLRDLPLDADPLVPLEERERISRLSEGGA